MAVQTFPELEKIVNHLGGSLPKVTAKKMFGCHALWVNENVFALVWKQGRIGVKLPDATFYQSLMDVKGAGPWKAGPMAMSHWVLVPETFHNKTTELKKWLAKAHELCGTLEKSAKKSKPAKKAAAKIKAKK